MGQALYRKYRSKTFGEVIGQDHITKTLDRAIKNDNFSHAYLLTGPRGVGKTSIARIIAHNVNGLEYIGEASHLDIIEIDAASNRRIDEIRELRDKIYNAPTNAKYKVYIIDEVHMLTREAFNALLKTLEEPPAHALFILATTEAHKVPETIISRTQQFHFKAVSEEEVADHLLNIAKKENIKLEPDAARLLAKHGAGSFRDSIGFLEQAAAHGNLITSELASDLLGLAPETAIKDLLGAISQNNSGEIIGTLDSLYTKGVSASQVSKQLIVNIRQKMIDSSFKDNSNMLLGLTKELLNVPMSGDPTVLLEVTLVGFALSGSETNSNNVAPEPVEALKTAKKGELAKPTNENAKPKPKLDLPKIPTTPDSPVPTKPPNSATAVSSDTFLSNKRTSESPSGDSKDGEVSRKSSKSNTDDIWQSVLEELKSSHNTLHSFAKTAKPSYDGKTLHLLFQYPFHQKRLNETAHKALIATIIKDKTGSTVQVLCEVSGSAENVSKQNTQALKNISNIFGGAEVIDS